MSEVDGFDEVRYPECLQFGVTGGPRFKTGIIPLASGKEQRNQMWSRTRGRWETSRVIDTETKLQAALDFFYARGGPAYGFRFKDWTDYRFDQVVGTGTGSQQSIQLFKRYTSGPRYHDRYLQKIVAGSYTVYFNGVAQVEGSPSLINVNTGILTANAPAGQAIRVVGEFDVPVRFDSDAFDLTPIDKRQDGSLIVQGSLPIIELKLELS